MAESYRVSVSAGIDGGRDDDLAFVHDWGVSLDSGVPVSIWQGDKDRMVPHSHGEWLAAHTRLAAAQASRRRTHVAVHQRVRKHRRGPGEIAHTARRCTSPGGYSAVVVGLLVGLCSIASRARPT
jgi:hypothetical protein